MVFVTSASRRLKGAIYCALILFSLFALPAHGQPKRIISIAPSFTEILYAVGAGNKVVGTTLYCDYPAAAQKTAKIGDVLNPNVEKIISLKPDLVFAGDWKWNVPDKLRAAGIKVVEIKDAQKLNDIFNRFILIGKEVAHEKEANALVASMKTQMEQIRKRSTSQPKQAVYMDLDAGNWTIGGTSYLNEIMELIGVRNIFAERKEPYLTVTMESIVSRNPEILLSLCRTKEEYVAMSAWQALRPVQKRKIIDKNRINWFAITHQGSRLVSGIEELEKALKELNANH